MKRYPSNMFDRTRLRYGMFWPTKLDLMQHITWRLVLHMVLYLAFFTASLLLMEIVTHEGIRELRIKQLEKEIAFRDEQLLATLNGGTASLYIKHKDTKQYEFLVTECKKAESLFFSFDDPTILQEQKNGRFF